MYSDGFVESCPEAACSEKVAGNSCVYVLLPTDIPVAAILAAFQLENIDIALLFHFLGGEDSYTSW